MRRHLSLYGDRLLGRLVKYLLASLSRTNPDRASDLCGAATRRIGPLLPAHRIGRANLRAAFPDKDAEWIEATLRGAWENLGRVAGEYVHLGQLWDYDPEHPNTGRIITDDEQLFLDLQNDDKPALCFAAHLGNWELPAVMAAAHGLPSAVLYRMPNNKAVASEIIAHPRAADGPPDPQPRTGAAGNGGVARSRRASRHAGRSAFLARRRRHVLWPPLQGQSIDRPPRATVRLSRRWRPRHPAA